VPRELIKSPGDADSGTLGMSPSNATLALFERNQGALWRSLTEPKGRI
jgi:hypothetical protein